MTSNAHTIVAIIRRNLFSLIFLSYIHFFRSIFWLIFENFIFKTGQTVPSLQACVVRIIMLTTVSYLSYAPLVYKTVSINYNNNY